jgi:hypothetical protein
MYQITLCQKNEGNFFRVYLGRSNSSSAQIKLVYCCKYKQNKIAKISYKHRNHEK